MNKQNNFQETVVPKIKQVVRQYKDKKNAFYSLGVDIAHSTIIVENIGTVCIKERNFKVIH